MNENRDERILVFARGRDGCLTREILDHSGLTCSVTWSVENLCCEIASGAGVLILAEEMLTLPNVARLVECLAKQPPWSDLPVIVVAGRAANVGPALKSLEVIRNVSVLPRPLPIGTLVTAVQSSLRARRRQYEVRNLLRDREEADRRKDEFLAMLAHELRNPLAPIRSAVEVLRMLEVPDPAVVEVREILDRQVGHMGRLIDDLLDVSRISRGTIELRKQRLDLCQAAEQAAETARPLMALKCQRFDIALPTEPVTIEADSTRLVQVISNVLNNAAKFTGPAGRITLSVGLEDATAVIRVRDTGVGISPDLLPRVFDLFKQAEQPLDRTQGGLGIGLTVVKSLVEQHGGRVEARSPGIGKGTEIVLTFPIAARMAEPGHGPDEAPRQAGRHFRVLVVEDNQDAARMLARVFRLQGHEVRAVHDGPSALNAALEFRPDVILSDIGLPGIDGYQVAKWLRNEPSCKGALLVALTGYGQREDESKAREAGFDYHFTKPLDLKRLDTILTAYGPVNSAVSSHEEIAIS